MGDSKRTLEAEMAISHVNCGTYCTFAGYDQQNNINLYQCVNCKRTFMLAEFVADTTDEKQDAETPETTDAASEISDTSSTATSNKPGSKKRHKETSEPS